MGNELLSPPFDLPIGRLATTQWKQSRNSCKGASGIHANPQSSTVMTSRIRVEDELGSVSGNIRVGSAPLLVLSLSSLASALTLSPARISLSKKRSSASLKRRIPKHRNTRRIQAESVTKTSRYRSTHLTLAADVFGLADSPICEDTLETIYVPSFTTHDQPLWENPVRKLCAKASRRSAHHHGKQCRDRGASRQRWLRFSLARDGAFAAHARNAPQHCPGNPRTESRAIRAGAGE